MRRVDRILVLGAYGSAGRAVTTALTESERSVVAAGRNRDRLEALADEVPEISTAVVDIRDADAVASAMWRTDLVINCVGPYIGSVNVARAAVVAGVPYFDLASEQEHFRRLRRLDEETRPSSLVLTGLGAYPGLSGIMLEAMLRRRPTAHAASMSLIAGEHSKPDTGAAQAVSGILELAHPHEELIDGALQSVRPGRGRLVEFPSPFGMRTVMRWPQLEMFAVAARGSIRDFSTYVALGGRTPPPWIAFQLLRALRPVDGGRVVDVLRWGLSKRRPVRPGPTADQGAVVISVRDGDDVFHASAIATDLERATAWLPVYATRMLAEGRLDGAGLKVPMEVFDPDEVLRAASDADAAFIVSGL